MMTSILGVSGLKLDSCGTEPVTFFGAQSSLGGHNSRLGGTSSDLVGHGLGMPPRVAGPVPLKECSIENTRTDYKLQ